MKSLVCLLTLSCLSLLPLTAFSGEAPPDWVQAQKDANQLLFNEGKVFSKLVEEIDRSTPQNGQTALFRLVIYNRAGMRKKSLETIHQLKELTPDLNNSEISSIYYDICDHFSYWEVAQTLVETYAENIAELDLQTRLIKNFPNKKMSIQEIDQWLANKPPGINNFWRKERLRFNKDHHRAHKLIATLSDDIKKNPADLEKSIDFLEALLYIKDKNYRQWDLEWLTQTVKPRFATDAERLADRLKQLLNWAAAEHFYRLAIEIPLTEKEIAELGRRRQVYLDPDTLKAQFMVTTREELARCLKELKHFSEAQEWIEQAARLREKYQLGLNALLAGQIQSMSGQRTIEISIKKNEILEKNDPRYWYERAQYYRGRRENFKEESALNKGLELSVPQTEPAQKKKAHTDWRAMLLSAYVDFLKRADRTEEAVTLIFEEIQNSPPQTLSAQRAISLLINQFKDQIHFEREVLWTWLEQRPRWEHLEERLLWRLLESVPSPKRPKYFFQAEKLARGHDPTRTFTLGWILNRMQEPQRSITLLKESMFQAQEEELRKKATFALFESYLDLHDWKNAERLFPQASEQLTAYEVPEWYARIALAAAKSGAREDALRLWEKLANINPYEIRYLNEVADAGLREELIAFYKMMNFRLPGSEIPKKALISLKEIK